MNLADAGVLIVLVVLVIVGLRRGLVGQCLLLAATLASFVVAALAAYLLATRVGATHPLARLAAPIAFFICLLVASWTLKMMARGITRMVHTLPFASLDRMLGALVSLVVGGIILSLLCLGLVSVPFDNPVSREVEQARTTPYLLAAGRWTVDGGARHLGFLEPLGAHFRQAAGRFGDLEGLDETLEDTLRKQLDEPLDEVL